VAIKYSQPFELVLFHIIALRIKCLKGSYYPHLLNNYLINYLNLSGLTLNVHSFATTNNKHIPHKCKHNRKRYRRQTQPITSLSFTKTFSIKKETISTIVMSVHPHHFTKIFSILNASSFTTLRSMQAIVWLIDYTFIPTRFRNRNTTSSLPKVQKSFWKPLIWYQM